MSELERLLQIMRALRDPQQGCPWDRQQTYQSLVSHTLEEAFEVADAIDRQSMPDLQDELGDLLFQVVFYSQLAQEQQKFDLQQVMAGLNAKLIRRHPHVFGSSQLEDAAAVQQSWEAIKAQERAAQAKTETSRMDRVPANLEPLLRAAKLQKQAAGIGFDWPDVAPVFDKCLEELDEIRQASEQQLGQQALTEEIGDLLFCVVNLARHLKVEPSQALRQANLKFIRRFKQVEQRQRLQPEADLALMEQWWQQAKQQEQIKSD